MLSRDILLSMSISFLGISQSAEFDMHYKWDSEGAPWRRDIWPISPNHFSKIKSMEHLDVFFLVSEHLDV